MNSKNYEIKTVKQELDQAKEEIQFLKKEIDQLKESKFLQWMEKFSRKQKIFVFSLVFICSGLALVAGTINKPHTFTDGTTILASQVNENFDIIFQLLNGNLTSENISGIDASKITSGTLDNARLSSTSSTSSSSSAKIVLFEGASDSNASQIDAIKCIERKNELNLSGTKVGLFISKKNIAIKDLIGGDDKNLPVFGPTNIKISDSWNELWDGNIDLSLKEADITTSSWWSGSNLDGTVGSGCENGGLFWGNGSNYVMDGYNGSSTYTDQNWITPNGANPCGTTRSFLCYTY